MISENFQTFLDEKEKYVIDDDVREQLLLSNLNNKNKIKVCFDVTPTGAESNNNLSSLIAKLLVSNSIDYSKLENAVNISCYHQRKYNIGLN
ncbi:MAG: hypothetical protein QM479_13050 [Pseudomonadota bacterium]